MRQLTPQKNFTTCENSLIETVVYCKTSHCPNSQPVSHLASHNLARGKGSSPGGEEISLFLEKAGNPPVKEEVDRTEF